MQHYISDSIYGLTLAWITSENSTKQLECRHLDSVFFAGPYLMLARLSAPSVRSRLPLSVSRRQLPVSSFFQLSSRVPLPLPVPPRFQVQNPLSGFAPKQTKESSAWQATYIVLHIPHLKYVRSSCNKRLQLLCMIAHIEWGADRGTLLKLYRSLIRSKLVYGIYIPVS